MWSTVIVKNSQMSQNGPRNDDHHLLYGGIQIFYFVKENIRYDEICHSSVQVSYLYTDLNKILNFFKLEILGHFKMYATLLIRLCDLVAPPFRCYAQA